MHLLSASRTEQGLTVLDGATANVTDWLLLDRGNARIALLDALGRVDELQQQRWDLFCCTLSIRHLRAHLNRLADSHPLAAIILLRSMAVCALSSGRTNRYRNAAGHLQTSERLAEQIDDWQGQDSQTSFVGRLREIYGRSVSFWRSIEP